MTQTVENLIDAEEKAATAPVDEASAASKSPLVFSVRVEEREELEIEYRNSDHELVTGVFHLKTSSEMSLEDQLLFGRNGSLMTRVGENLADTSPAELKRVAENIKEAAWKMCHDVPREVFDQLQGGHYMAILGRFGEAST